MLAPEGYLTVAIAAFLAGLLALVASQFAGVTQWIVGGLGLVILAFTLYFFRDPNRSLPDGVDAAKVLVAPADGKVILIEDVAHEPLFLDGPARQVSIFLSPLNVHVNRVPASGLIEYDEYVPGEYLVAWHEKSSELNERSQIGVRHPSGVKILFKQIAGAVARRIVYHISEGDTVKAGERFGIVKFGSRMDVLVPPSISLDVTVGDVVRAGETILGTFDQVLPADSLSEIQSSLEPTDAGR